MIWKRVRLELARTEAFPNGSRFHAYDFVAPLDPDGVIGEAALGQNPARAAVKRSWQGEPERKGRLIQEPDGGWAFSFDGDGGADETLRLKARAFKVGDEISVQDEKGVAQPFRVAAVRVLAMA